MSPRQIGFSVLCLRIVYSEAVALPIIIDRPSSNPTQGTLEVCFIMASARWVPRSGAKASAFIGAGRPLWITTLPHSRTNVLSCVCRVAEAVE